MDPVTAVAAASVALVVKAALESAGQEAGRSGWNGGTRLIERIRARFRGDAAAEAALVEVTRAPDDESARQALERVLAAHMLLDRGFEDEIRRMVDEAVATQGKGAQVNAALIKNAQVFNEKVEIQGDWNIS
jgi:Flp pilus assembly protein TadD